MPPTTLTRALLVAIALAASALHAQAPPNGSITLDTGTTFPAWIGQSAPGGQISFTAPFLNGKARTNLAGIVQLNFPRSRDEKRGAHCVQIVNGDRIIGDVVEFADGVIVLDSAMLGELEIPRDIVHGISRRDQALVIIDSVFTQRANRRWRKSLGWVETEKGLSVTRPKFFAEMTCMAPHDGPVTLVVAMDASMNPEQLRPPASTFEVTLSLFTNSAVRDRRADRLEVKVGSLGTVVSAHGNGNVLSLNGDGWATAKGELRIAYEPATAVVQVWLGEKRVINNALHVGIETGRFVHLSSTNLIDLRSVRMYRSILPPGVAGVDPVEDTDGILLLNGDRLDAGKLEIEDERAIAHTPDGNEFTLDLDKIGHIVLRRKGRRSVPMRKGDVRLHLQDTHLLLSLEKLTDELVTGSSVALGKLSIPRAALTAIDTDVPDAKRQAGELRSKRSMRIVLDTGAVLPATVSALSDKLGVVSAPWLTGAAQVELSKITRIDMQPVTRHEPGGEMLFLTDGSRILGAVHSISPEAFELRTKFMGAFQAPRKFVQSLSTHQQAVLLDTTDFTSSAIGKWEKPLGLWRYTPVGLHSSGGPPFCVSRELTHDGPMTVEVSVRRPGPAAIFAALALFSIKPAIHTRHYRREIGHKGVVFDFGTTGVRASDRRLDKKNRRAPSVDFDKILRSPFPPTGGATTFAWDPATHRAAVWAGERFMGSGTVKGGSKSGNYIVLGSGNNPLTIEFVRVWGGIAAAGPNDELAADAKDVVVSRAGKATSSAQFTMTDGKALADLDRIMTARNTRTAVRRTPEHVRVGLARSVILLSLKSMDAQFLEGVSPTLGSVRIPRNAVRWIEIKAPGGR